MTDEQTYGESLRELNTFVTRDVTDLIRAAYDWIGNLSSDEMTEREKLVWKLAVTLENARSTLNYDFDYQRKLEREIEELREDAAESGEKESASFNIHKWAEGVRRAND